MNRTLYLNKSWTSEGVFPPGQGPCIYAFHFGSKTYISVDIFKYKLFYMYTTKISIKNWWRCVSTQNNNDRLVWLNPTWNKREPSTYHSFGLLLAGENVRIRESDKNIEYGGRFDRSGRRPRGAPPAVCPRSPTIVREVRQTRGAKRSNNERTTNGVHVRAGWSLDPRRW